MAMTKKASRPVRFTPKLVAHLPASLSAEFHRKAEHLQISASVLASRLLEAIVVSNIYEAVLDDKD
jgi:hypothetical protein